MINPKKVRVIVVDDSAMMRQLVVSGLKQRDNIEIVAEAADAFEARDKIMSLKPDVLVMDVVMPKMDGLTFLRQLMSQYPVPCVMISSTAEEKQAIAAGAADFMAKPKTPADQKMFTSLLGTKVIIAAGKKGKLPKPAANVPKAQAIDGVAPIVSPAMAAKLGRVMPNIPAKEDIAGLDKRFKEGYMVALGASTGGTDALECVIKAFPETMPPIVVVQHMPPVFTKLYSERMDKCCTVHVKEAENGDRLVQGLCLIGAGGLQMEVKRDSRGYYVKLYEGEKVSGHCPSVDVMFTSVAEAAGNKAVGAIMTGMGADGAQGLLKMHQRGAYTIGQDKESCIVYGMPMEAYKLGACSEQQPLNNIGRALCRRLTDGWTKN
ncbi:MAG: chemotaxis response regulator protein-glutamate methylesterase [Ruminococcus sp.]|nr:chemotaxis response regulator protein-glutamate methylesterase [Ruminococcus sp.]MCM1381557.1 chemotaxis response regulator protein-glutamate methylesterase [Muribaculaceae bacterium]MCM1479372.1 chemotaxis response regulator protein-glutamate methylesterase [Muribaculaceae bacterium]